jgi:hypothetical protein
VTPKKLIPLSPHGSFTILSHRWEHYDDRLSRLISQIVAGVLASFEREEPARYIVDRLEERLDPERPEDVSAYFDLPPEDFVRRSTITNRSLNGSAQRREAEGETPWTSRQRPARNSRPEPVSPSKSADAPTGSTAARPP